MNFMSCITWVSDTIIIFFDDFRYIRVFYISLLKMVLCLARGPTHGHGSLTTAWSLDLMLCVLCLHRYGSMPLTPYLILKNKLYSIIVFLLHI